MARRVVAVTLAAALTVAIAARPAVAQYLRAAPSQTPQQQKLKDCEAQWQEMKKKGITGGRTWAEFRNQCMR